MNGCHPSYTAQECQVYCQRNPEACEVRQVPEPGTFALLAVAFAAWAIVQLRRYGK